MYMTVRSLSILRSREVSLAEKTLSLPADKRPRAFVYDGEKNSDICRNDRRLLQSHGTLIGGRPQAVRPLGFQCLLLNPTSTDNRPHAESSARSHPDYFASGRESRLPSSANERGTEY